MRINGTAIAARIEETLKHRITTLKKNSITPHIVVIHIGDNPASKAYVKRKKITAEAIGAMVTIRKLPKNISWQELQAKINQYNTDPSIHGIIIQRPLPPQIDKQNVAKAVLPQKDIDGLHHHSLFPMPLAVAVIKILKEVYTRSLSQGGSLEQKKFFDWLRTKTIVVLGKGETGGLPIYKMFQSGGAAPKLIDSQTENPHSLTKKADIVISAVGKANIIRARNIKHKAILISVGIHKDREGKLKGDYDEQEIKDIASWYTPSPGGVGPVNVACLLENLVTACEKKLHFAEKTSLA